MRKVVQSSSSVPDRPPYRIMVGAVSADFSTAAIIQVSTSERRFAESNVIFSLGQTLALAAAEKGIEDPNILCTQEESAKQLTGTPLLDDRWLNVERLRLIHSEAGAVNAFVHSLNPTVGAIIAISGSPRIERSKVFEIARMLSPEAVAIGLSMQRDKGIELSPMNFQEQASITRPGLTIGNYLREAGESIGTNLSVEKIRVLATIDENWD